jgi:hypothetical protein
MTNSRAAFSTHRRKLKKVLIVIFMVAIVISLAWPTTSAQSPLWEVWVVNDAGQPLEAMTVTLHYQNYSAEPEGHSEQKRTDVHGYAVFSPRTLRTSRWRRIVTTLQSAGARACTLVSVHTRGSWRMEMVWMELRLITVM